MHKIAVLSYLEPFDRLALSGFKPVMTVSPKSQAGLRSIYGFFFQKISLWGIEDTTKNYFNTQTHEDYEEVLLNHANDAEILVTCHAPILSESFIKEWKRPIINIHFGISRFCRGMDTVFWPLYLNRPEHVGMTLHHVDVGIDTGRVIVEFRPEMSGRVFEGVVWRSLLIEAKELIPLACEKVLNQNDSSLEMTEKGQLFLARERTAAKEFKLRLKEMFGITPRRTQESQIKWY